MLFGFHEDEDCRNCDHYGLNGADAFIVYTGKLPGYYVTKKVASKFGWADQKGNLASVLPGKMIGGDIYYNREKKLPSAPGRIWYEADIDYVSGFRNKRRILYSGDGLCFVSYDHYKTFTEITR